MKNEVQHTSIKDYTILLFLFVLLGFAAHVLIYNLLSMLDDYATYKIPKYFLYCIAYVAPFGGFVGAIEGGKSFFPQAKASLVKKGVKGYVSFVACYIFGIYLGQASTIAVRFYLEWFF